ncbi:MAG: DUF2303 family protein [Burkholderiales bacterium]|nr:DUF2303 family protein [Burkholderiales bacterium]MEB2353439.1 DUF2303 family protein [Burkholderiaceae bacterium]
MNHDPMEDPTVGDLVALGSALALHSQVRAGATPYAVIPAGYTVHDLEHTLPAPMRKRGTISVDDEASFIELVNRHKTAATTIYAKVSPPAFVAVINDHSAETAGWRDHKIIWAAERSHEWKTWTGANKRGMKQVEFAQFIEDNLPDIVEPAGAEMLEISRTLEAKKKVNFASGIRLSNGQTELTYEEEIQGTAAKGKLQIPEAFVIGLPVLEGGARYAVSARLRYRIAEAQLLIWFDLERPHKVLEDAVQQARASIAEKVGLPIVLGSI